MVLWCKQNGHTNGIKFAALLSVLHEKTHTKHLAQELAYNSLNNRAIITITVSPSNRNLRVNRAEVVEKQNCEGSHTSLQTPSLSFRGAHHLQSDSISLNFIVPGRKIEIKMFPL